MRRACKGPVARAHRRQEDARAALHQTLVSQSALTGPGWRCMQLVRCQQAHLDSEVGSLGLVLPGSAVSVLIAEGVGLTVPCLRSPTGGGDTEGDLHRHVSAAGGAGVARQG